MILNYYYSTFEPGAAVVGQELAASPQPAEPQQI